MKIPPQAMEKLKEFAVKAFQEVLHWAKKQVSQTWKDLTGCTRSKQKLLSISAR